MAVPKVPKKRGPKPKLGVVGSAASPAAGRPEPPEDLTREASREWARVVGEMEHLGLLSTLDRAALALYCDAWQRLQDATAEVKATGLVVETAAGGLKGNPAVAQAAKAWAQVARMLDELGLTPAARARLGRGSEPAKPPDKLAQFIKRKQSS